MTALWDALGAGLVGLLGTLPLGAVKALVVLGFAGLASLGFFFARGYIYLDAPDRHWWRDLRFWAVVVLALEAIPYLAF